MHFCFVVHPCMYFCALVVLNCLWAIKSTPKIYITHFVVHFKLSPLGDWNSWRNSWQKDWNSGYHALSFKKIEKLQYTLFDREGTRSQILSWLQTLRQTPSQSIQKAPQEAHSWDNFNLTLLVYTIYVHDRYSTLAGNLNAHGLARDSPADGHGLGPTRHGAQSQMKMLRRTPDDPIASDWSNFKLNTAY